MQADPRHAISSSQENLKIVSFIPTFMGIFCSKGWALLPWVFFALKITNSATEQLPLCLVFGKNKGEEGADGQRNVSAFTISRLQGERVHLSSPNVSQGYSA